MNVKKLREVMNEHLIIQNISVKCDKSSLLILKPSITGFDAIKHYTDFFILFYKILFEVVKTKTEERRIPYKDTLNNITDLELIYNCIIAIINKYPHKKFDIVKYKFNKKLSYFIYKITYHKNNDTKYIMFSYEIDEYDKYWFYLFDNKKDLEFFAKNEL